MAALRPFPPTPSTFPSFAPSASPSNGRPATEVRFSRWNNANAEPFERRRRLQQEIEDDIRLHRRHESASRIAEISSPAEDPASSAEFKSRGTPSSPSAPSIRGRASKYSKPPRRRDRVDMNHSSTDLSHPAFRSIRKVFTRKPLPVEQSDPAITIGEKGIAYKFEEAPFVFQYSYTETPKVKPVALRETPYLPFGPNTMPRPWTGRAPLPPSKKKLPEFDSFKPPPPGKKGVKHVQAPGPFVAGSGPRHAMSREEVLGEPLTTEEVRDLVRSCIKTTRQLNMGRDGLTHNMLDNIHAHWKRRRVCKIKCKGVCTVDMDNVRQQLEEKTGGKVIYSKGGVIYLFRGRNYNYRSRPKFPLMLWKPTPPVYPRLVDRVPEGLTLEEATEMRKKGRQLPPICKLGKNGVYLNLVKNVKEAFEECELVRIDCKGMNKSDCRKIGAKLKDLVPCVLLSFEFEHILMWRGNDWKSSLPPLENNPKKASDADPFLAELEEMTSESGETSDEDSADLISAGYTSLESDQEDNADETEQDAYECESEQEGSIVGNYPDSLDDCRLSLVGTNEVNAKDEFRSAVPNQRTVDQIEENLGTTIEICNSEDINGFHSSSADTPTFVASRHTTPDNNKASEPVESSQLQQKMSLEHTSNCLVHMLKNAIETGSAVLLDDGPVDADVAYQRAVELAKTATPGPVFKHSGKKVKSRKTELRKGEERDSKESLAEVTELSETKVTKPSKRSSKARSKDLSSFPDVVPHGSLKVDELAKLLA